MATTPTRTRSTDSRTRLRTGLYGQLNREWDTLGTQARPDSWGAHSVLARHHTPEGVLEANRRSPAHTSDHILIALLALCAQGDDLAGRAVLQAFLGKIRRLSNTAAARGVTDPVESTLAAAWEAIRSYPLHLRTRVAGNLSLETLRRLPQPGPRDLPEPDHQGLEALGSPAWGDNAGEEPTARLIETLTWALDTEALSPADVRLLARMHLAHDATEVRLYDLADELGISYDAAQRRHSRAVRRLRDAVTERLSLEHITTTV